MPDRQCTGCTKQEEWGCTAKRWRWPKEDEPDGPENWINPAYLPVNVNDEESWACPRQELRENQMTWNRLLLFYSFYQKGHLPDAGAVVDQSNQLMELFRILDDANAEADKVLAAKAKAPGPPQGGRGRRGRNRHG